MAVSRRRILHFKRLPGLLTLPCEARLAKACYVEGLCSKTN